MDDGAIDKASPIRDPSILFFEQQKTRRVILLSYWIVVLLAIPLWWSTTSIERLSLPYSRLYLQRNREVLHFNAFAYPY